MCFQQYSAEQLQQIAALELQDQQSVNESALKYVCQQVFARNSDARLLKQYLEDVSFRAFSQIS